MLHSYLYKQALLILLHHCPSSPFYFPPNIMCSPWVLTQHMCLSQLTSLCQSARILGRPHPAESFITYPFTCLLQWNISLGVCLSKTPSNTTDFPVNPQVSTWGSLFLVTSLGFFSYCSFGPAPACSRLFYLLLFCHPLQAFIYYFMHMGILRTCIYMCTTHMPGGMDPLQLELQTVVRCHVGAGS